MKAITVCEPYASYIADGVKQFETRSWATKYRGSLLIHAGKRVMPVPDGGYEVDASVTKGCVIAVAELTDVIPMTAEFMGSVSEQEKALGFWSEGRYAWKLEHVQKVAPFPVSGQLGLWNCDTKGRIES